MVVSSVVVDGKLLPKPAHSTWEKAAANPLRAGTAYRMLVGEHGARMKQGDVVLVRGAEGSPSGAGGWARRAAFSGTGCAGW